MVSKLLRFFEMLKIAQNCYKIHENASTNVSKCFTMLQNCSKRFKMLANCFKIASKHFRNCFKIALNLLQNYVKVASKIALISLRNSFTFLQTWHRNSFNKSRIASQSSSSVALKLLRQCFNMCFEFHQHCLKLASNCINFLRYCARRKST